MEMNKKQLLRLRMPFLTVGAKKPVTPIACQTIKKRPVETFWRHRSIAELSKNAKCLKSRRGEVTERLKVHDWKSCVPLIRVPGVRIPPSPPLGEARIP
jgi:hypothetical protein